MYAVNVDWKIEAMKYPLLKERVDEHITVSSTLHPANISKSPVQTNKAKYKSIGGGLFNCISNTSIHDHEDTFVSGSLKIHVPFF